MNSTEGEPFLICPCTPVEDGNKKEIHRQASGCKHGGATYYFTFRQSFVSVKFELTQKSASSSL